MPRHTKIIVSGGVRPRGYFLNQRFGEGSGCPIVERNERMTFTRRQLRNLILTGCLILAFLFVNIFLIFY